MKKEWLIKELKQRGYSVDEIETRMPWAFQLLDKVWLLTDFVVDIENDILVILEEHHDTHLGPGIAMYRFLKVFRCGPENRNCKDWKFRDEVCQGMDNPHLNFKHCSILAVDKKAVKIELRLSDRQFGNGKGKVMEVKLPSNH